MTGARAALVRIASAVRRDLYSDCAARGDGFLTLGCMGSQEGLR